MPQQDLDTLVVRIAADTAQLRGELAKATNAMARAMQQQAKEVEKVNATLDKLAGKLKGAVAGALAGLSIGRLTQLTREAMQFAEGIERQARALGIGVERFQEWEYGARQAGIEVGKLGPMLDQMRGKLAEAASGKGEGLLIFQQLQLQLKDATGQLKSLDQMLPEIADKMAKLGAGDRLNFAKALVGEGAASDFVRFTEGGAAGLRKMQEEARKVGVVLDSDTIKRGAEMNRQFDALTTQIDTKLKQALIELGPVLLALLDIVNRIAGVFKNIADLTRPEGQKRFIRDQQKIIDESGLPDWAKKASREQSDREIAEIERRRIAAMPRRSQRDAETSSMDAFARSGLGVADRLKGAPPGPEDPFTKKIREAQNEAAALAQALKFDQATADFNKLLIAFGELGGRIKPTTAQVKEFAAAQQRIVDLKKDAAFKEFADQNERLTQITRAEAEGNRELVAVLEARFALEDKLGKKLTETEAARIDALARARFKIEESREATRAWQSELEGGVRSAFEGLTSSLLQFGQTNETVWERMRSLASSVLDAIIKKMLELAIINPLLNAMDGGNRMDALGVASKIFGAVGSIFGGGTGGANSAMELLKFADGGRPPVGVPSIVGERGRELFVPDVAGTIIPNGKFGGAGTVNLFGRDSDKIEISELKAGLKRLGMRVNHIDASIGPRAVGAMVDAKRRGGAVANAFSR